MGIYPVLRMEGSLRATGGTFKVPSRVGESKVLRHGKRACPLGCTSARSRLGPPTIFSGKSGCWLLVLDRAHKETPDAASTPPKKSCWQQFYLCIIQNINGLVTRCSSLKRNRKPIGERASSKLGCPVSAGSHAATKPKARSPMGFLLSGLPVLRTIASTPVVVARKESVTGMQPCDWWWCSSTRRWHILKPASRQTKMR